MSQILLQPELSEAALSDRWMTVIFNNEVTTMDEVVMILITATGCTVEEAEIEAWEAHTYGKTAVHFASKAKCEEVAAIISTVGVQTEVSKEWND